MYIHTHINPKPYTPNPDSLILNPEALHPKLSNPHEYSVPGHSPGTASRRKPAPVSICHFNGSLLLPPSGRKNMMNNNDDF